MSGQAVGGIYWGQVHEEGFNKMSASSTKPIWAGIHLMGQEFYTVHSPWGTIV